jgi:hypothetical protein
MSGVVVMLGAVMVSCAAVVLNLSGASGVAAGLVWAGAAILLFLGFVMALEDPA